MSIIISLGISVVFRKFLHFHSNTEIDDVDWKLQIYDSWWPWSSKTVELNVFKISAL